MSEQVLKTDIAVVGAGPAGLAAACAAAESGLRVIVIDENPWPGGQVWKRDKRGARGAGRGAGPVAQARRWLRRFNASGAMLLERATVIAAPAAGVLLAERAQQPLRIHWQRLILATGARELFLPFPGWTLPGVMGPGGLLSLAKQGWPVKDRRVAVAGSGPLLLAAAYGLKRLGARVVLVAEQAPFSALAHFAFTLGPSKLGQAIRFRSGLLGVPHRYGTWPIRAEGEEQVCRVALTDGQRTWIEECDLLACGFGLTPSVELPLLVGCELKNRCVQVDDCQATSHPDVYCAGEPTGIGGADCALVEGQIAGYAASGQSAKAEALFGRRSTWHRFRERLATAFALRPELKSLATPETIFCRCEDVTLGTVRRFSSWREAKLHSRCGMGPCQGRICGAAAHTIFGWAVDSVRPPVLPARVASLIAEAAASAEPQATR